MSTNLSSLHVAEVRDEDLSLLGDPEGTAGSPAELEAYRVSSVAIENLDLAHNVTREAAPRLHVELVLGVFKSEIIKKRFNIDLLRKPS